MPTSIREQVLTAFEARLGMVVAANLPGVITVYRGLRKPVPDGKLPALVMKASPVSSDQESAAVTRNVERITVTAFLKNNASDAELHRQGVDLGAAILRAVEADPTLGGIAVDTNLTEADQDEADGEGVGGLGDVFFAFAVEFWTRPGDPYTAAP
ncbi:hypothetical protein [Azospirillum picis]|uniref:DUF3168 domain-containing protein n=1 Tax=Azospirillum picis TaxID=488438 RepID=A0ABU0MEC3_9PROT|nr:hypothetical protein [Azospirillum picis]MBP2297955.1 hypothetical protein [Azospirillum picis]MDQ0531793.1 hypothetical protein [Azospirillum picis]